VPEMSVSPVKKTESMPQNVPVNLVSMKTKETVPLVTNNVKLVPKPVPVLLVKKTESKEETNVSVQLTTEILEPPDVHLAQMPVKVVMTKEDVLNVKLTDPQLQNVHVLLTISKPKPKELISVPFVTKDVMNVAKSSITVMLVLKDPEELKPQNVNVHLDI